MNAAEKCICQTKSPTSICWFCTARDFAGMLKAKEELAKKSTAASEGGDPGDEHVEPAQKVGR